MVVVVEWEAHAVAVVRSGARVLVVVENERRTITMGIVPVKLLETPRGGPAA